jgi:hypothetical protein
MGPLLVLLPLIALVLPESPRWLEAHGHHEAADKVVTRLERESEARSGRLSPPVVLEGQPQSQAKLCDLFGREYGRRSALFFVCWVLGYSGLIHGPLGFLNLYLVRVGFNAQPIFTAGLVAAIFGSPAGLIVAGRLNERFERKAVIRTPILRAELAATTDPMPYSHLRCPVSPTSTRTAERGLGPCRNS